MILLLTSCVNPNGMMNTTVCDSNIRREQYVTALTWYLENTNYDIYFVDNSNVNIAEYLNEELLNKYRNRLVVYYFDGNKEHGRGKGVGELEIINFFIKHTSDISQSLVAKVTGRIIINNISSIVNSSRNSTTFCVHNIKMKKQKIINSRLLIASVDFYKELVSKMNMVDETKHIYIENLCYAQLLNWAKTHSVRISKEPIKAMGVSGTTGKEISKLKFLNIMLIRIYATINNFSLKFLKKVII